MSCLQNPMASSGPTNFRAEPSLASLSTISFSHIPACPGTQYSPTACRNGCLQEHDNPNSQSGGSHKMMVSSYKTTQCHDPDEGTVYLHHCENFNSSKCPTWDLWMENAQASRSGICLRDRSAPPPVLTIHRSGFITVSFFEQNRTTGRPKNHKEFGVMATTQKLKVWEKTFTTIWVHNSEIACLWEENLKKNIWAYERKSNMED